MPRETCLWKKKVGKKAESFSHFPSFFPTDEENILLFLQVLPVEIDPASGLLLRRREKRARRTGGADELLGRDGDGGEGEEEGLFAKRRIPKVYHTFFPFFSHSLHFLATFLNFLFISLLLRKKNAEKPKKLLN